MKILYILDCKLDVIGGSQKSTMTTMNGMIEKKCSVTLYSQYPNNLESKVFNKKIRYVFFKKKNNNYINALCKLLNFKKYYKKTDFDIVHVQNTRFFVILGLLLKLKLISRKDTKFVYTDRDFYTAYTKRYQRLIKNVANQYDLIYCTTSINAKEWSKIHKKVEVIPNALEKEWFNYERQIKEKIRNNNNLNNKYAIGFCGRFVEYKRWDVVLKICNKLKIYNDIHCIITVSLNNPQEEEKFKEFEQEIKSRGIKNISIYKNADTAFMKKFYYMINAFVLTSDKESFGRTLIEAMTKHNIVFGTNTGGVPEVINDPYFLFDNNDINTICEKIIKIKNNTTMQEKYSTYFMNYCKKNYSDTKMINSYYASYERIINKGQ